MAATEAPERDLDELEQQPEEDPMLEPATGTIHERIVAILAELPSIGKTAWNEQQRFHYRGHDDVMNAINPLLAKHGVFFAPRVLTRTTAERQTQRGSTMYEVCLHVEYTFYAADGSSLAATAWGEGTDMGDKSTNKAMTMALKNVLAQVFALATAELSDADATSPEETTRGEQERRARAERGGQVRASTSAPRTGSQGEFDPGRSLMMHAIEVRTREDADTLRVAQRDLDPNQPWADIENYCALHVFGKGLDDLARPETAEHWKRLANAVVKVNELAGSGDFPPPTHEQIREGYAWAFKGVVLALSGPETPSEGEEDKEPATDAAEPEEPAGEQEGA